MTHGHYVAMGGLAAEFTIAPGLSERLAITPDNFSAFVERLGPDFLPNLSEDEIADKSKANGLAKTIVCIQALWFGVQCFTRWSQALTISLLELNTLGHTYSALAMYLLWWYKPLDVSESTVIDDENFRELAAAWSLRTGPFRGEPLPRWLPPQCSSSDEEPAGSISPSSLFPNDDHDIAGQDAFDDDNVLTPAKWYSGFRFYGFSSSSSGHQFKTQSWRDEKDGSLSPLSLGRPYLEISAQERLRWKLAARRYAKAAAAASVSDTSSSTSTTTCQSSDDAAYREPVVRQVDDWFVSKFSIVERADAAIGMILGGFVYGGIHALAWAAPFPSAKERVLWRMASVVVIAFGPVYVSLWHLAHKGKTSVSFLATAFYRLILAAYLFSRTYLVVECFIQLAHLPMSAYYAPNWSAYFPHF